MNNLLVQCIEWHNLKFYDQETKSSQFIPHEGHSYFLVKHQHDVIFQQCGDTLGTLVG